MEKLLDTWQEVRKGLFVVDPDVEYKRFLDRMVQRPAETMPSSPSCTAWRNPLDGAVLRRRRSMPC